MDLIIAFIVCAIAKVILFKVKNQGRKKKRHKQPLMTHLFGNLGYALLLLKK